MKRGAPAALTGSGRGQEAYPGEKRDDGDDSARAGLASAGKAEKRSAVDDQVHRGQQAKPQAEAKDPVAVRKSERVYGYRQKCQQAEDQHAEADRYLSEDCRQMVMNGVVDASVTIDEAREPPGYNRCPAEGSSSQTAKSGVAEPSC